MESKRILLVDDDVNICDLFSMTLEQNGYDVVKAYDGMSAMGVLTKQVNLIDMLVTDVRLSGFTGVELCKYYLKNHKYGKVVFITGNIDFDDIDDVQFIDNVLLLQKPFAPSELNALISKFFSD